MDARPQKHFALAELAQHVEGEVCGDGALQVNGINTLTDAGPHDITFITKPAFATQWASSRAAAALVTRGVEASLHISSSRRSLIIVRDAEQAMLRVLELFQLPESAPAIGVHSSAVIHPTARLGKNTRVGAHVSIGAGCIVGDDVTIHAGVRLYEDVSVGDGTVIHANSVIRDRCVIGSGVIIHQNVSIGADGFGYRPAPDGSGLLKMPHIGNVLVEDNVEIGANTCVDRGKFGSTIIGKGTKIDNLCQIAHNCRIGRNCVLAGQTALAGSVVIGDFVQIGGQVGIAEQLRIGSGVKIGAKAGVMRDVPDGAVIMGIPAEDASIVLRQTAAIRKLPDLLRKLSRSSSDSR